MKHILNKTKFLTAMEKRGWKFDSIQGWLVPHGASLAKREQDWIDSILESVECVQELRASS